MESTGESSGQAGVLRLKSAHISYYRSVVDSKPFNVEELKTILVGPNESGKNRKLAIPGRVLTAKRPDDQVVVVVPATPAGKV